MGRIGQSVRLAVWSVTKRSCETGRGSRVGRICLAVNRLCGKALGRGGVRCSAWRDCSSLWWWWKDSSNCQSRTLLGM